jgi:basic amino acid/polyamine antiporter, APA family
LSSQQEESERDSLSRTLGRFTATLLTAAMIIGTGIFGALGSAASRAGSGILVAIVLGGLIALFTGISAAQLGVNYPKEGGAFTWAREFNHRTLGFAAGCAYLGKGLFSLSVISLAFAAYSSQVLPGIPQKVFAAIAIVFVILLNMFNIQLTTKFLIVMMSVNVLLLGVFVVFSAPHVSPLHFSNLIGDNGLVGTLAGAAIFFWTWDGFMRTAIMAGEIKEPRRTIPFAIIGGISIAAVVYVAVASVALGVLGPVSLGADDVPLFRAATVSAGVYGGFVILATAWTASLSELVGDMLAASRVVYTMGRAGELLRRFGTTDRKHSVPRQAVILLGLVVLGLSLSFDLRSLLAVASVFTLFWYSVTHFSALKLPKDKRLTSSLFTWLGLAGCFALFASLPPWALAIGLSILAVLVILRSVLRHHIGIE